MKIKPLNKKKGRKAQKRMAIIGKKLPIDLRELGRRDGDRRTSEIARTFRKFGERLAL